MKTAMLFGLYGVEKIMTIVQTALNITCPQYQFSAESEIPEAEPDKSADKQNLHNFVVLDMDEDLQTPIILGRPFMATVKTLINVEARTLTLRVQDQYVVFNLFEATKRPAEQQESLDSLPTQLPRFRNVYESLGEPKQSIKLSRQQPPKLELKPLPEHLKYAHLGATETLPVIVAADLTPTKEDKLLHVLRKYQDALGWTIADIKGISPAICMHKILMEDDMNPTVDAQRRLNPIMKEVIKTEVMKLLDAGMFYPISDSKWVSPTQVVPKHTGITVVKNDNNELIPMCLTTGWRMCVDYRKLNTGTRKDHFPLPFTDQMLERLAGRAFYCFLDGYSGYNHIPIAPKNQEKTTFTCPFGTFTYQRMPFGLCNAPATFQRCMMSMFSGLVERIVEVFMDDFSGIVLGHSISSKGIEVDKAKIDVIAKLPPPTSVKGVRSFLGHAGFYRRFIKDFSKISRPLCNLLSKDAPYYAVGVVLGQRKDKLPHVIYYASRTLNDAQLNYATTEKELLAIKDAKPRLIRWVLLLQEFDLEIKDKKASENMVPDHLSRLIIPAAKEADSLPLSESFLDEQLFAAQINIPWFVDVVNYLATGVVHLDFSFQQKKKFLSDVKHYFWDEPYLYKYCPD
ncbi:uncharacterized protein LOC126602889 [Malus sylvestris]|uniref:uncharacterized protein LOC126602889 n=1 Tax=Malus sylvestris TaxID=3752 RepID=UPI0021AD2DC0|nr:uncharacterized protein LOC126602889 [Malus sylvestris]